MYNKFKLRNDKKFDMLLTGVMDGCAWCEEHKSTWSDPDTIQQGFQITRSMAGLYELWDSLDKNRHGELIRRPDDFSVRKGLCHKPSAKRDLFHFTICHKVKYGHKNLWVSCMGVGSIDRISDYREIKLVPINAKPRLD